MAAFESVWQLRTEFTPQKLFAPIWHKWVWGGQKSAFFSTEISAWCAFGCKYFSMGWMSQKGPEGSKVCAKTSLNPIRHSNPEILHFESKKICISSVKQRGSFFKFAKLRCANLNFWKFKPKQLNDKRWKVRINHISDFFWKFKTKQLNYQRWKVGISIC